MNATAANILKILSQTEVTVEDMQLYLSVEKNAIFKTISQINDFLESINLPKIQKKEELFFLNLTNFEWEQLFNSFSILNTQERIDYLYIKFISHGFLNLEKEKDTLDLSRSTILRYFQTVKEKFSNNGTKYEYLHGRGLRITKLSLIDKNIFYRKIMKLFFEEDTLVPPLKALLGELKKFNTHDRLAQIYPILKLSNISINSLLLSFLHSLEICSDIFEDSLFKNESYIHTAEFKNINSLIDKYGHDFSPRYKEELTFFLTTLALDYNLFEAEKKEKSLNLLGILKKEFSIVNLSPDLEEVILHNIYFSFFKFKNKIIDFKTVTFSKNEKIILNRLNFVLEKYSYKFFPSDKFSIVFALERALIEENFSSIKNVLFLFNEVNSNHYNILKQSLSRLAPHIKFDLESLFFHKKIIQEDLDKYDLIVCDEKIHPDIFTIDFYSNSKIQTILEEKAFSLGVNKFYKK